MTVAKITISLPPEAIAKAKAAVRRGTAKSISAYIAKAVQEKQEEDDLQQMLNEMLEETGGPMTPEEEAHADRVLGLKPKQRRRRRR